jgi:sugar O-acyltransferase (sialic acid O-acetyltransferase NeuD family)
MRDIVIIGAGGFGREVKWLIDEINRNSPQWNFLGFVDDGLEVGSDIFGNVILGDIDWLLDKKLSVVCAVGDPIIKKKILRKISNTQNNYPILIHPSVIQSDSIQIDEGTIICAGTIMTVNINIGKHVIINLDCTIGHDVEISDYCTILPSVNVSGEVLISDCVSVGTGTQIIQQVRIGENSIIGAGAVVSKSLPENIVAVGIPARIIKTIEY